MKLADLRLTPEILADNGACEDARRELSLWLQGAGQNSVTVRRMLRLLGEQRKMRGIPSAVSGMYLAGLLDELVVRAAEADCFVWATWNHWDNELLSGEAPYDEWKALQDVCAQAIAEDLDIDPENLP